MKKSTKFWRIMGVICLILLNCYWYYYETILYPNAKFGDNSMHTMLWGLYTVTFDIIFLLLLSSYIIPKFNNWLDSK